MRVLAIAFILASAAPAAAQSALETPSAAFLAREVGVAEETIAADASAVSACLEGAHERAQMLACAQVVSEPCFAGEAAFTTYGQWVCARRLRAAFAPALEAARQVARSRVRAIEGGEGAFEASEAAWENWTHAWCGLAEASLRGGSQAKVALSHCHAHADIAHVSELRMFELSY